MVRPLRQNGEVIGSKGTSVSNGLITKNFAEEALAPGTATDAMQWLKKNTEKRSVTRVGIGVIVGKTVL